LDIVAADVIDELDVDGLIQLYTDEITAVLDRLIPVHVYREMPSTSVRSVVRRGMSRGKATYSAFRAHCPSHN